MIQQKEITLPSFRRGFHIVTNEIIKAIGELPETGLVNLFIKHTSAALTINENADPSVLSDFESFMKKLVPEQSDLYTHIMEGTDDMPAHIKTSLFGTSLTIPVTNSKLNLGTWQGIYLCEFRNSPHRRKLIITVYS
ncbi:MAG: secondary thiamine-phosphate synthase enzyme YjbQ [Bacteroidales bacterium]